MTVTGSVTSASLAAILSAVNTLGKYVSLDLSAMTGTDFLMELLVGTGADKIVSLTFPNTAQNIGGLPNFYNTKPLTTPFTSLSSVSGTNVKTIGELAFYKCASLASASFPAATGIGDYAFIHCASLASASFPAATGIGRGAFSHCAILASVSFPLATSIGEDAFYDRTSLTSASFPAAASIGKAAFDGCASLASASFPAATSIGDQAFGGGCDSLASITLPASLIFIGSNAFPCQNLATVICNATTPPSLGIGVFIGFHASLVIKVPADSVDEYKAASGWSDYADRIIAQ
jgi:hypothetical protein